MEGIQDVTDEDGERVAVVFSLARYGDLWEDFHDCLTARTRADEPRETLGRVKDRLREQGKPSG